MQVFDIEDLPTFKDQIGKAGCDRIKYVDVADSTPVARGTNVLNTVLDYVQGMGPSDSFCGVNDIVAGVARLDHQSSTRHSIPLSKKRLYNILQMMPVINCREVQKMLGVEKRQAQKYVKACKIMMPFLEEYFKEEYGAGMVDDSLLMCDLLEDD